MHQYPLALTRFIFHKKKRRQFLLQVGGMRRTITEVDQFDHRTLGWIKAPHGVKNSPITAYQYELYPCLLSVMGMAVFKYHDLCGIYLTFIHKTYRWNSHRWNSMVEVLRRKSSRDSPKGTASLWRVHHLCMAFVWEWVRYMGLFLSVIDHLYEANIGLCFMSARNLHSPRPAARIVVINYIIS